MGKRDDGVPSWVRLVEELLEETVQRRHEGKRENLRSMDKP
jgi:hypothetical protein